MLYAEGIELINVKRTFTLTVAFLLIQQIEIGIIFLVYPIGNSLSLFD